jgi:hypothetical protein
MERCHKQDLALPLILPSPNRRNFNMPNRELNAVEILVEVAMPEVQSRVSEQAWELDILKAVSTAVHADKTLQIRDVRIQEYEDCEWIYESGMPISKYNVTIFQDGGWWGTIDPVNKKGVREGEDLQSLFDYLVEKGLLRK